MYFTLLVLCSCTSGILGNQLSHHEDRGNDETKYEKQFTEPEDKNLNMNKSEYEETKEANKEARNADPFIWEDESHYVQMPDDHGEVYEVDPNELYDEEEVRTLSSQIQYLLYTRQNPTEPQLLIHGNYSSVTQSNYHQGRPLNVIVHGFLSDRTSDLNLDVTRAFLYVYDCNVVVVDWSALAKSINYKAVSIGVPEVGQNLGNFLTWLLYSFGGDWSSVHLIGHSLGAHVVGNAGRAVGGRVARITGLDPASPLWRSSDLFSLWGYALNRADGQYVEAIHTGAGLGLETPVGHADFYPNQHGIQPGCFIPVSMFCSHRRAYDYFAASIVYNQFLGRRCENLQQAIMNQCAGPADLLMGNADITKRGYGIYGLSTGDRYPYFQ